MNKSLNVWIRILIVAIIFVTSIIWLLFLVHVAKPEFSSLSMDDDVDDEKSNNHVFVFDNKGKSDNKLQFEGNVKGDHLGPAKTGNNNGITFPSNLEQLKELAQIMSKYSETNFQYVLLLFSSAYLFKQTFAIPGSVFLNLLAGTLYGTWIAFPLCCFLTASGATCCYLLSKLTGQEMVEKYFSKKLESFREKIRNQRQNNSLFPLLISLRLFPMTPNWFLNIVSPIVGIPVHLFFLSVFFGLMPYNFVCIQTGSILSKINSMEDIFTWPTFAGSISVAVAFALPALISRKIPGIRAQVPSKIKLN